MALRCVTSRLRPGDAASFVLRPSLAPGRRAGKPDPSHSGAGPGPRLMAAAPAASMGSYRRISMDGGDGWPSPGWTLPVHGQGTAKGGHGLPPGARPERPGLPSTCLTPGSSVSVSVRPQRRRHRPRQGRAGPSHHEGGISFLQNASPCPASPLLQISHHQGRTGLRTGLPRGGAGPSEAGRVAGRSRWARAFCPASLSGTLPGRVRIPSGALQVVYLWHSALFIAGN